MSFLLPVLSIEHVTVLNPLVIVELFILPFYRDNVHGVSCSY